MKLHWKILVGLLLGLVGGLIANATLRNDLAFLWFVNNVVDTIGQLFLRIVFMVVVPLVFCALTLGVAGIGDVRELGRLGLRTFMMTVLFSATSVFIGLGLANYFAPGKVISEQSRAELRDKFASQANSKIEQAQKSKSLRDAILDVVPKNPLQEAVGAIDGSSPGAGMLGVMFFSLCFGVALTTIPAARALPVIQFLEGVYAACIVIVEFAMRLAPIGVCSLVFSMVALLGFEIVASLLGYVLIVIVGLAVQMFIVYSASLRLIARINPIKFFVDCSDVLLTAFGTSSSSATLPTSLRVAAENLKLDCRVANFVLTIGSTANQNGTALYEGITVLFLAQVFNVELTFAQQIFVVLMCVLAGVGTAGVPGGSLPLVVLVLQSIGIPAEGIGIILGVDRLLDMCRTTVNVTGDLAIATCVNQRLSSTSPI